MKEKGLGYDHVNSTVTNSNNNAFVVNDNNSNSSHRDNNIDNSRCNVNSLRVNLDGSSSDAILSNFFSPNTNINIFPTENSREKESLLLDLRSSYEKGLSYFQEGNYALAEAEFASVLRPVLSKPEMQSLYVSVEDCKEEALSAIYHLGKIYLNSPQYFNNYAKAAGIFQYCAGFEKKHGVSLKTQSQSDFKEDVRGSGTDNEKNNIENNNDDKIDFLREAYLVEERFLKDIGRGNIAVSDNNNLPFYYKIKQAAEQYKQELAQFREYVAKRLEELNELTVEHIAKRALIVEEYTRNVQSSS